MKSFAKSECRSLQNVCFFQIGLYVIYYWRGVGKITEAVINRDKLVRYALTLPVI